METTKNEIKEYYQKLKDKLKSNVSGFEYNRDRSHNSVVFRFMLDESKEIYMFCGELSVLRKPFYKHIVDSGSSQEVADLLMNKLNSSFSSFVQKDDTQINIILESYQEDTKGFFADLICPQAFSMGLDKGTIHLFCLSDKIDFKEDLSHFTVSDIKLVRLEKDKIKHGAICSLNSNEIFNMAMDTFFKIKSIATPINTTV